MSGRSRRLSLAAATAALLAAFVTLACLWLWSPAVVEWDRHVAGLFEAGRSPGWDRTFWLFTLLGDDSLIAPLAAGLLVLVIAWGKRVRAAALAGGLVVSWGAVHLAKWVAGRARPPAAEALIESPASHSMPSGHALIIVVFTGLVVYALWRWRSARVPRAGATPVPVSVAVVAATAVVAAVVVVAVGISRVYLGVHWMTDVLAGWCLGGAVLSATLWVAATWDRNGGPRCLRDVSPWRTRRWRRGLIVAVLAVVVLAAGLTVWSEPLL